MKKLSIFLILLLIFSMFCLNLISAKEVTGKFTITSESIVNNSDTNSPAPSQSQEQNQQENIFSIIKDFFESVFNFFKG